MERQTRTPASTLHAPAGTQRWSARRLPVLAIGTAVAFGAVAIGVQTMDDPGPADRSVSTGPDTAPSTLGSGTSSLMVAYDLDRLVAESARIVVGRITEVRTGTLAGDGGMDYVMGTVTVEETIRGPKAAEIVAFDYSYGNGAITAGAPKGASLTKGERVLLFLADTAGTVNAAVKPLHWQVTGGGQGEYQMRGSEPEAPFTLDQVRRAARG